MDKIDQNKFDDIVSIEWRLGDDFYCYYADGGTLVTNVQHLVVHHSPAGYNIGYAGSGPADLALNILENFFRVLGYIPNCGCFEGVCTEAAWRLHQKFKHAWVMGTTPELVKGTTAPHYIIISFSELERWLMENGIDLEPAPEDIQLSTNIPYESVVDVTTEDLARISDGIIKLVMEKNQDYGDAWQRYGIFTPLIRLNDKLLRVKTLSDGREALVADEGIDDTLRDIVGYSLLGLLWLQGNKK